MSMVDSNPQPDTPEARAYNRARRWLEIGDMVVGFGFLVGLLATAGPVRLRDFATRISGDFYPLRLFCMCSPQHHQQGAGRCLDFYGFR